MRQPLCWQCPSLTSLAARISKWRPNGPSCKWRRFLG
jgi:hypothetical protein